MEAAKTSIERMPAGWHVRLCKAKRRLFYNGFRTRTIVESELADLGGKSPVREPSFREVGVPGVCLVRVPEEG